MIRLQTLVTLISDLRNESSSKLEDATIDVRALEDESTLEPKDRIQTYVFCGQDPDKWGDKLGLQVFEHIRGKNRLRHS